MEIVVISNAVAIVIIIVQIIGIGDGRVVSIEIGPTPTEKRVTL